MEGFKVFARQFVGLPGHAPEPEFVEFTPEHFKKVGISPRSAGMPVLEAYQLVNEFNRTATEPFVYWLEPAA
jgi:hypothetical protein